MTRFIYVRGSFEKRLALAEELDELLLRYYRELNLDEDWALYVLNEIFLPVEARPPMLSVSAA